MSDAEALFKEGKELQERGLQDEAIDRYKAVVVRDSTHTASWNALGLLFKKMGRLDESVDAYKAALSTDPGDHVTWNNLGNVYLKMKNINEAAAAYNQALAVSPTYVLAYINLALLYRKSGKTALAIKTLSKALQAVPGDPLLTYHLGLAHEKGGNYKEAVDLYRQALRGDKGDADALFHLGFCLAKLYDQKGAIEALTACVMHDEGDAVAWNNLGNAYKNIGERDRALEAYDKALVADPKYELAKKNRERLLRILKEEELARKQEEKYHVVLQLYKQKRYYDAVRELAEIKYREGELDAYGQSIKERIEMDVNKKRRRTIGYGLTGAILLVSSLLLPTIMCFLILLIDPFDLSSIIIIQLFLYPFYVISPALIIIGIILLVVAVTKTRRRRVTNARNQLVAQHDALVETARHSELSGNLIKAIQQYSDAHRLVSSSGPTPEFRPIIESDLKEIERLKEIVQIDLDSQAATANRLLEGGNHDEALRQLQPAIERARDAGLDHFLQELEVLEGRIEAPLKTALVKGVVARMSNKFQRVSMVEIKEQCERKNSSLFVDEEFIIGVLKDMLAAGDVKGDYFESTKSIMFDFIHGDDLDKEFAAWGESEKSKDGKI